MANIKIPYSKNFIDINIPDENLVGVLECRAHNVESEMSEEDIVNKALDNPIGSSTLEDLVRGKKDMVIITSDHTRPVPSKISMPILLNRIRKSNPQIKIKILVATGYHRSPTSEELVNKFGQEIVDNEVIINHVSTDKSTLIKMGILPSGGELWLNRTAIDTELLIAEGFIEPHFFAGFSGGRKSVLPGIAGYDTILANHCSEFIKSSFARTGGLDNNPIHKDMLYAAHEAKLAFILNFIIDKDKKIVNAFSGDSVLAHEEGCRYMLNVSNVKKVEADIVITSNGGYPLDQNIYQSVKGMTAAEACCSENGVIIMVSACNDGHGGQSFYDNMADAKNPREILDRVGKVSRENTIPDQWEFQILSRVLEKCRVILVTDMCDPKMITNMHMEHSLTFEEALDRAFKLKGKDAKVAVIPDGVSVIVK